MKNKGYTLAALVLFLALILTGCAGEEPPTTLTDSPWYRTEPLSPEECQAFLRSLDLREEEIALVDLNGLGLVKQAVFRPEGNYQFAYDAGATRELARSYLLRCFEQLRDHRAALAGVLHADTAAMTPEAFEVFYAGLFQQRDFLTLADALAETLFDYPSLAQPLEAGQYIVTGDKLRCTVAGSDREYLLFATDGVTLTLSYADTTEVYTK